MKKLIIFILPLLFLFGCERNTKVYTYDMLYMDTYIEVKLYDVNKNDSDKIFKDVDNIYSSYAKLADRYTKYDNFVNVYYLNNILKENKEIEIDSKLSELIKFGIDSYDKTDGYVNIAIGNLVDVWKEYRDKGTGVPSLYELKNCGSNDIKDISLNNNIFIRNSDVKIDLGAIAKGYVTEVVGDYLESKGITKYLINAGGNIKVGKSYKASKYVVGLEEPFNTTNVYKKLYVENKSIVTSGSYQRYYEYKGVNYNHIINPKTLYPVNYTKSVSIITDDSGYADMLSTYIFLLPIEEGIKKIDSLDNVEAIWYADKIYTSKGLNVYE